MSGYTMAKPGLGIVFEGDRLRREKQELIGELTVRCTIPGARTVNGCLLTGDFNFSSLRTRTERAKVLQQRAATKENEIDWFALLEEFCQGVFASEREGEPAIDLRLAPRMEKQDDFKVEGLAFPRRHPAILFGDGGTAKSYTGLYLAGRLAKQGVSVAYLDWELGAEEHRDRLERLFGDDMPLIQYCRCDRPLIAEADRIRRVVKDYSIRYAVFDSVAFACDGPPEAAEVAGRYFRTLREIEGVGSLHIAHINKSDDSDRKPFGSAFWHNGARATWNVQAVDSSRDNELTLGFFCRKANLGPLYPPASFTILFGPNTTAYHRINVEDTPDLADKMSIRWRMRHLLKFGSMDRQSISEQIGETVESISRTARRYRSEFIVLPGGQIGLTEKGA